jgi:hypothetical protein
MDDLALDQYVANQAKKGKKRYFIEKDLLQKGYSEGDIERALAYAARQKKEYGKKLLYGGFALLGGSILLFLIGVRIWWTLSSLLSSCFMIYDGYYKVENHNK